MSTPVFSAKFTVTNATVVPGFVDMWEVEALVEDAEGSWNAHNVEAGDVVFLDTIGDVPVGGSVSRYELIQVNSANGTQLSAILKYADSGLPVDPIVSSYLPGMVGRPSPEGFSWMAAEDVQLIPRRILNFARNYEMTQKLDGKLQTKPNKSDLQTVIHVIVGSEEVAKKFILPSAPAFPDEVVMDVIGGVDGKYGTDFTIVGDEFRWNGLGFDGLLSAGDEVRLVYFI